MEEFFTKKMKERLNLLEIVSLREIALALGLSQFSKKNKAEIIDDICSVCFVQDNYEDQWTTKDDETETGYFETSYVNDFLFHELQKKNDKKIIDYTVVENKQESSVRAGSSVVEYKIVGKDGKELKTVNDEYSRREREVVKYHGFIDNDGVDLKIVTINTNEVYDISNEDKQKWSLERYDTIGFNRYWSNEKESYVAKIISVNDRKSDDIVVKTNIDLSKKLRPSEEFDFSSDNNICTLLSVVYPIKKGERVLVATGENNGKKRIAIEVAKTLKNKCDMVFAIYPNFLEDTAIILEEVDKNATIIRQNDSPMYSINKVSVAFMRAKKFVEEGKNVVVVLGGLDDYCKNIIKVVGKKAMQNINKYIESLFRTSGVYENGGSMTIISDMGMEDELLVERLKSRFNFYAPFKDADTSLFPQVDFKNIRINKNNAFDE